MVRSVGRSFVPSLVRVEVGFIQFALGSFYAVHNNALSIIMKLYIECNNIQVELIRFREKYRLYTRLLLRTDEINATRMFTLGYSLQRKAVR